VKKRITDLEAGLAVLKTQANHPREAKIFLNSMKSQNMGGDLAAMASDVRRFTETGTVRTTTRAQKGKNQLGSPGIPWAFIFLRIFQVVLVILDSGSE
jgi:hypothetical protein